MSEERICVECKHHDYTGSILTIHAQPSCVRGCKKTRDVVTGVPYWEPYPLDCRQERNLPSDKGGCGQEGKFFEPLAKS